MKEKCIYAKFGKNIIYDPNLQDELLKYNEALLKDNDR